MGHPYRLANSDFYRTNEPRPIYTECSVDSLGEIQRSKSLFICAQERECSNLMDMVSRILSAIDLALTYSSV